MNDRPLIIDCDTGRDDALSIWLALAHKMPLAAVVASYGNTTLNNVSENCARVLALAGRNDIALWQGLDKPSRMHKGVEAIVTSKQAVSGNGLCNLEMPKSPRHALKLSPSDMADQLRVVARDAGPVDYIVLGPATNLAALCSALGSDTADVIAGVTMMGGKMNSMWAQMPGADFNVACDPFAVRSLLQSGLPVRLVPMDVTWPIVLSLGELEKLSSATEIGQWSCDLMVAHARHFAPEPVFRFHDPCVILAMLKPALFLQTKIDVVCDESSGDFGRVIEMDQGFTACIFDVSNQDRVDFLADILSGLQINQA